MLKHPDPEVQFLVEMLEAQRDQAVAQAAAFFRSIRDLEAQLKQTKKDADKLSDTKLVEEDCLSFCE